MYSNLKINKNIQKLVDGVYERANAAIVLDEIHGNLQYFVRKRGHMRCW